MSGVKSTSWGWFLDIAIGSVFPFLANCPIAQITPNGTLPNNCRVTTQDHIMMIEGGTPAGSNLFHSFREFSVERGLVKPLINQVLTANPSTLHFV